jgi:hypothetical protein
MSHWPILGIATILAPIMLSVGAGYYSTVRQCNQDASAMETQLTSTLLEIDSREEQMKSVLSPSISVADSQKPPSSNGLNDELILIENGAHYGDPQFKDHSLVSLVNQYNRLIRRVRFPKELKCYPPEFPKCAANGLVIDTKYIHPAIGSLKITGVKTYAIFADSIENDLREVAQQQDWHKLYGPVRLCSIFTLIWGWGAEPWQLVKLIPRSSTKPPNTVAAARAPQEVK